MYAIPAVFNCLRPLATLNNLRTNMHTLTTIMNRLAHEFPVGKATSRIVFRVFASFLLFGWILSAGGAQGASRDIELTGSLIQGGLVQGRTDSKARVAFKGRSVRVSSDGLFLIGFGRDEPRTVNLTVTFPDGHRETRRLAIKERKYDIQRIEGLPKTKVSPKPRDLARIRAEAAKVKLARARDDARVDFLEGFIWPVKGRISGIYGSQRILNGKPRRPHFGIDIAAPKGAPVRAPASGVVTLAHPDMFFSGGTLILDHGHGLSSSFLHLEKILVEEGARVQQGDIIARVGATGRVTGAHLDWRINLFGTRLDPALLMDSELPSPGA